MKKLFLNTLALFLMLTMSVSVWADIEKFVPANAFIQKVHYAPNWNGIVTFENNDALKYNNECSKYDVATGTVTYSITTAPAGQWQAQLFVQTGIAFSADNSYDISFDIQTSNGVGGITFKMGDAGAIVDEQIVTGANTHEHKSFQNKSGNAACDGCLVFDFGFAPANTTITISNISIVEKAAASLVDGEGNIIWENFNYVHNNQYKIGWKTAENKPNFVNVQGYSGKQCFYLTFPAADVRCEGFEYSNGGGAQIWLPIDQFILKETELTVTYAGGSKTFYIYNAEGADAGADNDAPTMGDASFAEASYHSLTFNVAATDPTTNPVTKFKIGSTTYTAADGKITVTGLAAGTTFDYDIYAVDDFAHVSENKASVSGTTLAIVDNEGHLVWNAFNWIAGTNEKYKIGAEDEANLPGNRNYESHDGHPSLYLTFPAADIRSSYVFDVLGAGIWLYLDQFTAQETEVVVTYAGGSKTFYIYYADGTSPDTEKPVMASATVDEESITATSVKINVAGTDNVGVAKYVVYNGAEKVGEYEADANNQIEITGLTPNTAYTYTVKAKDAARNESEAGINVSFTTTRIMASVCDQEIIADDKTIHVSCIDLGSNNYRIAVTSNAKMLGWNGTPVQVPGNDPVYLNSGSVSKYLSEDGLIMIVDFVYPLANPRITAPLYINFAEGGQKTFDQPNDITWGACDAAPAPKTASDFALTSEAELTLEIDGTSRITYTTSSTGAVTYEVNNSNVEVSATGLITAKTAGTAVITVKQAEDATYQAAQATINITINSPSAVPMGTKEWYAYGSTSTDGQAFTDGYTFHVTATGNEDDAIVVVECTMLDEARNPGAIYLHDVTNTTGAYEHEMTRSDKTGSYTYVTSAPLAKGQELKFAVKFAYAGGMSRTEVITYNVGAERAMPAIVVTSVEITPASVATMAIGETLDLVAVAKPSIATGRDITWSLESGEGVISLNTNNGHIEAITSGDAQVKAATANGVYAICNVHVEAQLEAATYNDVATLTIGDFITVANWSVTRNLDRKLVYTVVFDVDMTGKVMQVKNDVDNHVEMAYDAATKTATFTSTSSYADEVTIADHYFYFGGPRIELGSYTVGSTQAAPATKLVSINDVVENAAQAEPVNVVLGRKFVADGGLYTLSLPFDMSAEQIAEAFGSCYIAQLTSVEERGSDMLHLNFSYVEEIEAGVPYLFLPKVNITNPTIEGVRLDFEAKTSGTAQAMMHAVLQPTSSLEEGVYFLGADNYLYPVGSENNNGMKGLRAYFTLGSTPSGAAPRARVILGPQTATGMENATVNRGAQKVLIDGQLYIIREEGMFNVQGQLVK